MRPFIEFLMDYYNNEKNLIGVEIGTGYGDFTIELLDNVDIRKIYTIDAYTKWKDVRIKGPPKVRNSSKIYKVALNRLRCYNNVELIRENSNLAHQYIPNDIDFLYIDGNHTYNFVRDDILYYYQKIKNEGIIGGDDYGHHFQGVKYAVDEFINKYKLNLITKDYERDSMLNSEWMAIKNER